MSFLYLYYGSQDMMYFIMVILPLLLLTFVVQIKMKITYSKYSGIMNRRGISGSEAARNILDSMGLRHVRIERVSGELTDHFDPRTNTLRLSEKNYSGHSVAAVGVAAHEAGHAIQYAKKYVPVKLRAAVIPAVRFSSWLYIPMFVLGLFYNMTWFIYIALIVFSLTFILQLITLPVEFNASRRAISVIESRGILDSSEISGVKKVLWAAAMTYVVAFLVSLAQLIRILLLRRNDD